jgi:hypothetical protein
MSGGVDASPYVGAFAASPAADFTWLAFDGRGVDETALPSRPVHGAGVQETHVLLSPAQRDAALAQLSDDAEVDFEGSWIDDVEADDDAEDGLATATCGSLDALFAEF